MSSVIRACFALALVVVALGGCAVEPERQSRDDWFAIYGAGGGGHD